MAEVVSASQTADPAAAETALELRVLAGRSQGASAPLPEGRWIDVGHAFDNDVVIRDAGARGVRLRLRAGETSAEMELLEGAVSFLGHTTTAPASVILPAYTPLMLGESAVAFGRTDGARWPDALRLLRAGLPPSEADGDAPESEAAGRDLPAWRLMTPAATWAPKLAPVAPIIGGALAAVLIAAVLGFGASRLLSAAPSPAEAQRQLAAEGFKGVQVSSSDTGLVVRGVLPAERDVQRLRDSLARRRWTAAVTVRSSESLVRSVSDALRANGFEAEVRAVGAGVLAASVTGGDLSRLEGVRRRTLQEVAGLRQLVVNGGEDPHLLGGDVNKRVVSIVDGADGFIQTADGSRYFLGAVLPSGHTITAIEGQSVRVEKAGRTTELKF